MAMISAVARRQLSSAASSQIKNVAIIGGGLMGSGIAQVSAANGYHVHIIDQTDDLLSKSKTNVQKSLERIAKRKIPNDTKGAKAFVDDTLSRIHTSTDLSSSAADADLVIEAIVENLDVKRKLFADLDSVCKPSCILTTNTSSLALADIVTTVNRKDKFGGLHFFNPVPMMKLLEVVRIPETSDDTFKLMHEFGKSVGKTTVTCKDTPGFIVNRLLVPYMMEALRMAERGDASHRDIDTAMKLGAGYPMGPFELADYVGLDTTHFIIQGWAEKYPDVQIFKPSETLAKYVEEGKLGKKTGEGFYKY